LKPTENPAQCGTFFSGNRLNVRGQRWAGISHELKQPLAALQTFADTADTAESLQ